MKKKLIVILGLVMLLVPVNVIAVFAAENNADTEAAGEAVITLKQAQALADENSRDLKKLKIAVNKAKYLLNRTKKENNNTYYEYNHLSYRYDELSNEYNQLLENNKPEEAAAVKADLEKIEEKIEAGYAQIESLPDSETDAENNYDDAVKEEENYRKQLDYIVEELYVAVLNQENALQILDQECALKQCLLEVEKGKLALGRSSQLSVEQTAAEVAGLQKNIIAQTNELAVKKGQLNDLMGRDYAAELKPADFEAPETADLPETGQLLASAARSYDRLQQLRRELHDLDDDLDHEDDYYEHLLLKQDFKAKELEWEDEKIKLQETINNLVTEVKTKQKDYELSLTDYETARRTYGWDQKRYELGRISKTALMESELSYLKAGDKKISGGYALYLARRAVALAAAGIW